MTTHSDSYSEPPELPAALSDPDQQHETRRFLTGLALTASYGLALGARFGIQAMAAHAIGAPLAFVAVALVGGPAFYVALAHAGVDVSALVLTCAIARGIATAGVVLAGLAPALLLLAASCEDSSTVALYAAMGLAGGASLGLRAMFRELERRGCASGFGARLPRIAFAIFAGVFCSRIWWSVLPVLGGVQ